MGNYGFQNFSGSKKTVLQPEILLRKTAPTGGVATFSLVNIPTYYERIDIFINGRSTYNSTYDEARVTINGDTTAANYYNIRQYGGSGHGHAAVNDRVLFYISGANAASNFGTYSGQLLWPSNGTFQKAIIGINQSRYNSIWTENCTLYWFNTAPITSIVFYLLYGLFDAGTNILCIGHRVSV
jgi:hypothetical protein